MANLIVHCISKIIATAVDFYLRKSLVCYVLRNNTEIKNYMHVLKLYRKYDKTFYRNCMIRSFKYAGAFIIFTRDRAN